MEQVRILITVKTYPVLSRKYGETVCTAGVCKDGRWMRLYPVPFRRLGKTEQYQKYDWLECDVVKREDDRRPESYCPADHRQLLPVGHLGTEYNWRERRRLLLENTPVYTSMDELIREAKANALSLAVFKPSAIKTFRWKEEERQWNPEYVARMRMLDRQGELFSDERWRKTFKLIPKLPYSFSYRFQDATGKESELQIFDWEVGALYWNCMRASDGDEASALQKVRQKYLEEFVQTDLHFFVGTTLRFHSVGPNPWVIVGVFPAPHTKQMELV